MSDQNEDQIKLTLTGVGVSVTRTIDAATAAVIINIVMGGAVVPPPVNRGVGAIPQVDGRRPLSERISLREYLDDVGAARYPDKIVAIGRYMLEHEQAETFTREDVKGRFKSAGEAAPGNFARDFSAALKSGWIAEDAGASGSYYVTKKGADVIAGGFAAEIRKAARPRRRRSASFGSMAD